MLGDRAKHCIFELNKLLGIDKEYIDFDSLGEITHDGMKELDRLIEAKNECDTLKARVEKLEKENKKFNTQIDIVDVEELTILGASKKVKELQTFTEIGRACLKAMQLGMNFKTLNGKHIFNEKGIEIDYIDTIDTVEALVDWYKQQTESEK